MGCGCDCAAKRRGGKGGGLQGQVDVPEDCKVSVCVGGSRSARREDGTSYVDRQATRQRSEAVTLVSCERAVRCGMRL
jgi:hypothetical protein